MSEEHQLPSDSDEDDEDYVPDGADSDPVSEVESEGDIESGPEDENDENKRETGHKEGTKKSKGRMSKKTKRKKTLEKSEEGSKDEEGCKEKKELTEEEEKKRADSLWADFMKDTAVVKSKPQNSVNKSNERSSPIQKPKVQEKVKITKVFEFAGEEVKVEKEVSIDSAEARLSLSTAEKSAAKPSESASPAVRERGRGGVKRVGLGGISSVQFIRSY